MYELYKNEYKFASVSKKWYTFTENSHYWRLVHDAFLNKMNKIIVSHINIYINDIARMSGFTTDDEKKNMEKEVKISENAKRNMGMQPWRQSVVKELELLFFDDTFDEAKNANENIICFKNGVYDFEADAFRDGCRSDNFTWCVDSEYKEFDENDDGILVFNKFFREIFVDNDVYIYFMHMLKYLFIGRNHMKSFFIWSGAGCNGKSLIITFLEQVLSDFSCSLPVESVMVGANSNNSSSCTPHLARLDKKRLVLLKEPSVDMRLSNGIVKLFTGNDSIYTRGLYQEGREILPTFKPILICNTIPKINNEQASVNRLRLIPFQSRFTNEAPSTYDEQIDQKHFKVDYNMLPKLLQYKSQFCFIVVEFYKRHKNDQIFVPDAVKIFNDTYKTSNDLILKYVTECMSINADESSSERFIDVYKHYKTWLALGFEKEKSLNKIDFLNRLLDKGVVFDDANKHIMNYELNISTDEF